MGAAPQCAAASAPHDQRRRPEQTPLYRLVRQHYETFAAEVANASGGTVMPQFAKDEFNAYLDCGILAQANDFRMTPKLLSHRLGVRRVGITGAAGAVQRHDLIRYRRTKSAFSTGKVWKTPRASATGSQEKYRITPRTRIGSATKGRLRQSQRLFEPGCLNPVA